MANPRQGRPEINRQHLAGTETVPTGSSLSTFAPAILRSQQGPSPLTAIGNAGRLEGEPLKAIIENYICYYAAGDTHTARAKRYDLQYFLQFLAGSPSNIDSVLVSDWTLQSTKDFVDQRLTLGEAPATTARRLATIKHFGRTLAERIPGYINPAREAKSPVIPQSRPHGLTAQEITYLQEAANQLVTQRKGAFNAVRNRFLLSVLLATGLRADEVRLLLIAQISDDRCWLKNVKTKGRKFRNVYLDSNIRELLGEYLSLREAVLLSRFPLYGNLPVTERARVPLLVSFYHARFGEWPTLGLSPKSIWRIIAELGIRAQSLAEVNTAPGSRRVGNLHPHKLRHTFAHGLLDSSKDVRLVAQALGHSDVRVTMRYTERTEEELARAIERKIAAE